MQKNIHKNILYSNNSCSNIINHAAGQMNKEIISHILSSKSKFCPNATAGLEKTLQTFFDDIGLSNDVLCTQFVGFCSDGASCVVGQHRMRQLY